MDQEVNREGSVITWRTSTNAAITSVVAKTIITLFLWNIKILRASWHEFVWVATPESMLHFDMRI